jgi:ABC-type oligopeptide transport system substrate-binding subunit
MYGSNIVIGRDVASGGTKSYVSGSTAETVRNTARALSLNPVRKAILAALDYPKYFERYGTELVEQKQQLVHTYVPKGFVINDDGEDYVAGNYLPYYAEQKGLPEGDLENPQPGTAAWYLKPGQYESRIVSQEEMNRLVDDAKAAIALYNADQSHTPISYPVRIEYFSLWFDSTTQTEDKKVLPLMNQRLNYGEAKETTEAYEWFQVLPTDKITSANYEDVSRSACWDYAAVQWGWGADYGDPLTFMNTYRKGGDWADVFPFIGFEECTYYNFNSGKTGLVKTDLLAEYTEIVAEGSE